VTRVEEPSGRTSFKRTASTASGQSTASSSTTTGAPRISSPSPSGAESKVTERASSSRWSDGPSPATPNRHHSPAASPTDCGERTGSATSGPGVSSSRPGFSAQRRGAMRDDGHAGSSTQRSPSHAR
jgi:hypothetical protein